MLPPVSGTTWDGLPVAPEPPFACAVHVWRAAATGSEWLLLHRAHAEDEVEWAWTPPAGARLPGERAEDCARRELREEAGLDTEPRLVGGGECAWFVAQAPAGWEPLLDDEHDAHAWLPLEEACARCAPAVVADGLRAAAAAG